MSTTYAIDIKTMQQRIQAFEKQNHQFWGIDEVSFRKGHQDFMTLVTARQL